MKKLLYLFFLVLLPCMVQGQSAFFDGFYNRYIGEKGFTTVEITSEMIKMIGNHSIDKPDNSGSNALDGVDVIKIIVCETHSDQFFNDMKQVADKGNYTLLTTVNDSGQQIRFYFRDMSKSTVKPSEFMMLIRGDNENLAIYIKGDIDLKKISGLSSLGGMNRHLDKIPR